MNNLDSTFLPIYETYKEEFDIYEGLILSHPLYKVEQILNHYNYVISDVNYDKNKFKLIFKFISNYDIAKNELWAILRLTNNLGWLPSYISSKLNKKFKEYPFTVENFKDFILNSFCEIYFSFEAKYDIPVEKYPKILYHVCESKHVNKILKNGLIPKSRSKKSFHPDRIYLTKTTELAYELANFFNKGSSNREWAILEIDTSTIEDYLKLFKDPNYLDKGYFTLNNITPYCIKLNNVLYF